MACHHISLTCFLALALWLSPVSGARGDNDRLYPDIVSLPPSGRTDIRILKPDLLEIRIVQSRKSMSDPARPAATVERADFSLQPPPATDFEVRADGKKIEVSSVGIRRVPVYADYHAFDVRLMLHLFLKLKDPIPDGSEVSVQCPALLPGEKMTATRLPGQSSPAIHVSPHGFATEAPKFAFVSYDFGTLGTLTLHENPVANLVDESGKTVFSAPLQQRPDKEWTWYQNVWRFDFSSVQTPGLYAIEVPGLGRSGQIRIDDATAAVSARLLALGLYHQRSGVEKGVPFTRFGHSASHTRPAEIPDTTEAYRPANRHLAAMSTKNSDPVQSAPVMKSFADSLYPILRKGSVDVRGGHYDAGDYSKYVINSAQLIHSLVFAVDHFPGVDRIDNLGLPESGDGIADALQIARIEAEFLLKMQDLDGGFFFLVYPRDRPYELDVLPENGDPQVVFPKSTGSTAACTGALAQLAASPALKAWDPDFSKKCLAAALQGYEFLRSALKTHGLEGSYQTISHYGNFDTHHDELAYAAAALFVATGEASYQNDLMTWWPDPLSGRDKKWGWVPLYEAYGSAARVYAFADAPGFLPENQCDAAYLHAMRTALIRAADTWLELTDANAFGLPFSLSSKRQKRAGWFWAMDPALDLVAAKLLKPHDTIFGKRVLEALSMWSAYEAGGNPFDRSLITGTGPVWRRQAVNRISLNDDRKLAAPGIPIGNVISTPHNLKPYQIQGANGLRKLFYPFLDEFPLYERSATDAYNVREEWTIATGAKLLAGHLFLMAGSPVAKQPWTPGSLQIQGVPDKVQSGQTIRAHLTWPDDLSKSEGTIVWELIGSEPVTGPEFTARAGVPGPARLEAEVVWPDGRRLSAIQPFEIIP